MATISATRDSGEFLKTTVSVKSGRKKIYDNEAYVVEAFREKHIKVDLVDEDDHYFKLNWNGENYEGNFFGTTLTCQYDVTRDFKADISAQQNESGPTVYAKRSNGGRPNRYKE
ncbi:uncharacterized protein METZ01_LOCUS336231 [marine metagenome]|uniref:Uncharacterized protein n=1 Tax=marine metagenome TaxID=408172 RepID=A0A382QED0_9ZZZZ